ncbi:hypothetical protein H9635_09170 [Solibacillus sp. A46]|uniref:Lipoprotein n=1 Tax=Solibacillus faecavium TaxID=2762221 RepID=A0ABR8XYC0_9BACL|nr:hypothetical protein [Solibacillus faecavium]MBD8036914.1 hypothetical protein [Solibacillus faecavium]
MIKQMGVVLFSLLLLMGCNDSSEKRNTELEEKLNSSIIMVSDNSTSAHYIDSFVDFKWDKAFLVQPYTTQTDLEKQLGVKFTDPSNIGTRDDIYLLIFVNENKVVQYAEIERLKTTFSLGDKEYLEPSNDIIYIER